MGWEDDLAEIGAGWVMFDSEGHPITKGIRSFQKQDGSYPALNGMYAPKLKANPFGSGFLFGAAYFDWHGKEAPQNRIPNYADPFEIDDNGPVIQRVRNDGEFERSFMTGLPMEFLKRTGPVRLSDVGYLSDGNIVAVYHDMQKQDGPELYNLPHAKSLVLASVMNPKGKILHGPAAVQERDADGNIWHGLAAGQGHFGVRFEAEGGNHCRFFTNRLEPLTKEIQIHLKDYFLLDSRGEGVGWCGNDQDRYLMVERVFDMACAVVYNERGKNILGDIPIIPKDGIFWWRCDGAIDEKGNFICVFEYAPVKSKQDRIHRSVIAARIFDAKGQPNTPFFKITSIPYEDCVTRDIEPRIAWRNGLIAVVWCDRNTNLTENHQLALRIFRAPF